MLSMFSSVIRQMGYFRENYIFKLLQYPNRKHYHLQQCYCYFWNMEIPHTVALTAGCRTEHVKLVFQLEFQYNLAMTWREGYVMNLEAKADFPNVNI